MLQRYAATRVIIKLVTVCTNEAACGRALVL